MTIAEVEKVLAEDDVARPLTIYPLVALEPRRDPYLAMLCQPTGTMQVTPTRIGHSDSAAAAPMFSSFLRRAKELNADLVVTPEYSVPWIIFDEIASGRLLPPIGALWALGCESITPAELEGLRERLNNAKQPTRLLYESFSERERTQKAFIDPLLYVFWTKDADDHNVLCALVQFKTLASRDSIETTSLYLGKYVYKFNSNTNKVALLGIICSDAFDFLHCADDHQQDLLLLHIQLNQQPGHPDYAAYRERLFSVASNNRIEIVCLNWAVHVNVEGEEDPWNNISGSAWYIAPKGLEAIETEIEDLHRAGVYYSIVGTRWHGFYFNWEPHSLVLRKTAVFSDGPQVLVQRMAPQVVERRSWDAPSGTWKPQTANDGFSTFLAAYTPLNGSLPALCSANALAVERALELLVGPAGGPSDWFTLSQLEVLKVDTEESIRRITVSQETDLARSGVKFRRERVRKAQTAIGLPNEAIAWLPSFADLAGGFRFTWRIGVPHCNIEPVIGDRGPATLVYLGENPERDLVEQTYAKLRAALVQHAVQAAAVNDETDLNAVRSRAQDRLCVVLRRRQQVEIFRPPGFASITEPGDSVPEDIAGADL